ncbi:MAG: hypothetical protein RBU29_10255 [bacterium]|jgi:hypothetical protein|nr:hypothetical protein [bacterium]
MLNDLLFILLFLGGWFLLMKVILPALGIPTCCSGACDWKSKKTEEKKEADTHE